MATKRGPTVRRVAQEHAQGCGVATIAMCTSLTYDEVRLEVEALGDFLSHKGDWDAEGITHMTVDQVLAAHGIYAQMRWRAWAQRRTDDRSDPAAPVTWENRPGAVWPPEPWAPLHYASVEQASGRGHFVVVLADGTVLDPYRDGEYRLTDWPGVNHVVGLLHPDWIAA